MRPLNHSDDKKHAAPSPVLFIVERGRTRFLMRSSLTVSIILWLGISGVLMMRGVFHGLGIGVVVLLETVILLIVSPFAFAISCSQWKTFQKMAATKGGGWPRSQ